MEPNQVYKEYTYPLNLLVAINPGKSPSSLTVSDEFLSTLQVVLETLPDNVRTALLARYRDQMTFDEIGALLNLSGTRASQLVLKGIHLLRHPSRHKRLMGNEPAPARTELESQDNINGPENTSVIDMGLTPQAENDLLRLDIWTAGDILETPPQTLANTRGIGVGKLTLIAERLEALGLDVGAYRDYLKTV